MTLLMKASVRQVAMTIIIIIMIRMIMVKTLTVIRTVLITMTYPTPTLPSQGSAHSLGLSLSPPLLEIEATAFA